MAQSELNAGRLAAGIAVAAVIYFAIAAVATHLVNPEYNFWRDYISDYAVGPTGWIYGSAFIASCIGSIALAFALWLSVPHKALSRAGAVLLALVGLSYAIDFLFPTDLLAPGQPPQTAVGAIHLIDALIGWVLFVVAAFLITARLKTEPYFRPSHRLLLSLSWGTLVLLVALIVVVVAKAPIGGVTEKAFILVRNLWAVSLSILILRAPTTATAEPLLAERAA